MFFILSITVSFMYSAAGGLTVKLIWGTLERRPLVRKAGLPEGWEGKGGDKERERETEALEARCLSKIDSDPCSVRPMEQVVWSRCRNCQTTLPRWAEWSWGNISFHQSRPQASITDLNLTVGYGWLDARHIVFWFCCSGFAAQAWRLVRRTFAPG